MKILVAEDDPDTLDFLDTMLRSLGHEVAPARDGLEAWTAFQSGQFPIVISDWRMPEMDGLELCRRIRSEQKVLYTYFILVTAFDDRENYLKGMDAGADDFIGKPFDRDQLAARLRVAERILQMQDEIRKLSGLLPICSHCKKIRDEGDAWTPVEVYLARRTEASFSHGICPDCFEAVVKPQLEKMRQPGP